MMTTKLFPIERAAIEAVIGQHPKAASALRAQLAALKVTRRVNNGSGFFVHLPVPDDTPSAITDSLIGDPHAEVEGLEHGMGFLLMMRDGRMECLEGYTFEVWSRPFDFAEVWFNFVSE
jgi:hypothetical protein